MTKISNPIGSRVHRVAIYTEGEKVRYTQFVYSAFRDKA